MARRGLLFVLDYHSVGPQDYLTLLDLLEVTGRPVHADTPCIRTLDARFLHRCEHELASLSLEFQGTTAKLIVLLQVTARVSSTYDAEILDLLEQVGWAVQFNTMSGCLGGQLGNVKCCHFE